MKAWILSESPGTYAWGELDDPKPGPQDVAVRVVASSLNHMDLWLMKGLPRPTLPHVPGCDVAGTVAAIGELVTSLKVGDQVVVNPAVCPLPEVVARGIDAPIGPGLQIVGEHRWGGHAELVVLPERNVVPKPEGRSWEECAAYGVAYLTAWRMLRRARLRAGETLLVVGVGGGVGVAAAALGVRMGAHVVATSTQESKRAQATSLGVARTFHSVEEWDVRADVVVETVGPATWDRSIRALAPGGRLVVAGGTSGSEVTLNLPRLFFKQHEIIGATMGSYEEFASVTDLVGADLAIPIAATFPLADYPAALELLRRGDQFGKIVLRHD